MIEKLIEKGVIIPAPQTVILQDIDPDRIEAGVTLYPGTVLRGKTTFIGAGSEIGLGGGACIENCQIGRQCTLMQGVYRDSTMLDGFNARNGAEIRDNCLLEENVSLGHTVGLKQTIFMTNVVAGSLINFCDALMCGGTSRKNHSEIGSCMALYNFTPQGDKFASLFGDVKRGVWLNQPPIFIGGQTQIVSPVRVGFGSIIAAGSKLNHDVGDSRLITGGDTKTRDIPNDTVTVHRPEQKINATSDYINNLIALKAWYELVRMPALKGLSVYDVLLPCAVERIDNAIKERFKRLDTFVAHIHSAQQSYLPQEELANHRRALETTPEQFGITPNLPFISQIVQELTEQLSYEPSYEKAMNAIPDTLKFMTEWYT